MPPAPKLAALLATAALAAGIVPGVALAQSGGGAGDEQYVDPFGSTQTSGSSKQTSGTSASTPSKKKKNRLSQTPNLGASGTAGTSTGSGTTTPSASTELPRTGGNTGRLALIGLVLLLSGIGLRLRTADDRR